jgi:excinuclease UvrABC nuclease subunit
VPRSQYEAKGQLQDNGLGSVYVYFDLKGKGLYIGQTNRKVKTRTHDQTSAHKKSEWWPNWTTMRFVQLPDEMDRQVLEFLLILAYSPQFNAKPKAKYIDQLLPF